MAQRACQEKDQQGGGEDRGDGKKKGGPGAEEHPAGDHQQAAGDQTQGGNDKQRDIDQIPPGALMAQGVLKQMKVSQQIVETDAMADNGQRGHQREKSQPFTNGRMTASFA